MKVKTIYKEYRNTQVITGSPSLFFVLFWSTKLLSLIQRKSTLLNSFIHKIYAWLPQPAFVIKNMGGLFTVHPFDDSTTICSDYFEKDIRNWLLTPTEKNILIDIGANRGIYSIIAPTQYKYQKVHAFEPNPEVFTTLKKNIELNNLGSKVICHNLAVGRKTASLPFTVDSMHKGGGRIVTNSDETYPDIFTVSVQTLDTALADVPASQISFIKIDTEGHEFDVLSGMPTILTGMSQGSCLMIESSEYTALTALLTPYGFSHSTTIQYDHLFIKGPQTITAQT